MCLKTILLYLHKPNSHNYNIIRKYSKVCKLTMISEMKTRVFRMRQMDSRDTYTAGYIK